MSESEGVRLLSRRGNVEGGGLETEGPESPAGGWWPLRPSALAPVLAGLSCVLYCCNGELLQALQKHTGPGQGHASALLNLTLCHLGGLLFAPQFLWRDDVACRGDSPVISGGGLASNPRAAALLFALLLMGYNYAWLCSAKFVSVGLTNAVFQTSIAFVYLASTRLFAEPLTAPRMFGVLLSLMGSALASGLGDEIFAHPLRPVPVSKPAETGTVTGVTLALTAALGITAYQVFFRKTFGHLKSDWRFLAYFGAWVGVWHVLAILPLVFLASALGVEPLQLPSGRVAVLGTLASAAIASSVNALYLCIVMWGSPMLLPCSSALSVPLTVGLDVALHDARPAGMEILGHLMVVGSVVLIMELHSSLLGKTRLSSGARAGEGSSVGAAKIGRSGPPIAV